MMARRRRPPNADMDTWPKDVIVYIVRQDLGLRDLPEGDAMPASGWVRIRGEEPYLDGPVSRRAAVLDLDVATGSLRPGARWKDRSYQVPDTPETATDRPGPDIDSDAFLQVSVWGTVLDTVQWFEGPEVLGRSVRWAFGEPQIRVIPRAGEKANARYDRDTQSLQFFSVPARDGSGRLVHTCLSRDIVVHETTHAILDGIASDLLGAFSPQARAIHEAIADLAALFASFRDKTQIFWEFSHWAGNLRAPTAFSRLAEQLGAAVGHEGGASALRDANNDSTLDPDDQTTDRLGRRNHIADVTDIHALSSVMTGAVFRVLAGRLEQRAYSDRIEQDVLVGAERIARMVFRSLDLLPPGELCFADFGRVILAADRLVRSGPRRERDLLIDELVRRRVVTQAAELDVEMDMEAPELTGLDLAAVERDGEAARPFIAANRRLFGVPPRVRFTVHPPIRSGRRSVGSRRTAAPADGDLVLKVSWPVDEPTGLGPDYPARRAIQMGTTLVIDRVARRVRARLRSGDGDPSVGREDRQRFLRRLVERGVVGPADLAADGTGRSSTSILAMSMCGDVGVDAAGLSAGKVEELYALASAGWAKIASKTLASEK
jgi:hypothetical protein